MQEQKSYQTLMTSIITTLLFLVSVSYTYSQNTKSEPELSVAGIELGNPTSAKNFLSKYSSRILDGVHPEYWFYNKFGTQVMKITAVSSEEPFYITSIEVFAVDRSYMKKHYVLNETGFFVTENGIFIGYRQSALSIIVGVPNVGREDKIGPKDVIRKKGTPTENIKEEKRQKITYKLPYVSVSDGKANYQAHFEFYKNTLIRFRIMIEKAVINENNVKK